MDTKNMKQNTKNDRLEAHDDQLGENASEEYRSEEYANANQIKNKTQNTNVK